jgi:hypothetical protein
MPIVPIIFLVVVSLLSLVLNPYRQQAQDEATEKITLKIQQREKPKNVGSYSIVMFAVIVVVTLTAFMTAWVSVPLP